MGRPRWYPTPRRVDIPAPAAGQGWSRVNDAGGTWVIRSLAFRLVSDATAPTRLIAMSATAGEDVWFRTVSQFAHPANTTVDYSAWAGSPSSTVAGFVETIAWPHDGLWLPPGHILTTTVSAIGVADQISAIFLQVIELPEVLPASLAPMITTFVEEDGSNPYAAQLLS